MRSHAHVQVKPASSSEPSFTPATSRLLQRKCACGGTAGLSAKCAECRKEKLVAQNAPLIPPKVKISQPNDKCEQEADRVANEVMRLREPGFMSQEEAGKELLQTRPLIQLQANEEKGGGETPPIIRHSLRSPGSPLPPHTRAFMESRFGHDFSHVRVHADRRAAELARAIDARAYTVGRNVVFGAGQYAPETFSGQALLAHELTHVSQQQALDPASAPVQRYRRPGSINFGARDSATLKEKQFDSAAPDPYVEHIQINFTGTKAVDGETVPKGTLSATYANNGASPKQPDFSGVGILGGFPSSGLTDKTNNNEVDRVEGWGYHHKGVPRGSRVGSKWPEFKYFKPAEGGQASMSYALFFKDKIAIHLGGLDTGSLACVHVENESEMKRLNYHTRAGVTKVTVTYNETALKVPCCERYAAVGRMVSNPCGGLDPADCPP